VRIIQPATPPPAWSPIRSAVDTEAGHSTRVPSCLFLVPHCLRQRRAKLPGKGDRLQPRLLPPPLRRLQPLVLNRVCCQWPCPSFLPWPTCSISGCSVPHTIEFGGRGAAVWPRVATLFQPCGYSRVVQPCGVVATTWNQQCQRQATRHVKQ